MQTSPVPAAGASTAGEAVIQLDDVTVIYGRNQALKGVNARFARGAVGLLGPNGAGLSLIHI